VGIQQEPDALESELAWLRAIRRDSGIMVQEPVASRGGRFVETVAHPDSELDAKPVPCLVLTWVEGSMFDQKAADAEPLSREIGRVQARLHAHARTWDPPPGFRRPVYGEEMLAASVPEFERGAEAGIIRRDHVDLIHQAAELIAGILRSKPVRKDTWGPIHMDWSANLVVTGNTVVPIDFSLSGLGFYLQDVAQCMSNLKRALRPHYLAGYGAEFTPGELYEVSTFILMLIFITAAKNVFNPGWREWFQTRRLPMIVGEFCPKLLRGEPFLMEI
jgi:Ser/Thr protein kinase RdoA (MazF antagonist)